MSKWHDDFGLAIVFIEKENFLSFVINQNRILLNGTAEIYMGFLSIGLHVPSITTCAQFH